MKYLFTYPLFILLATFSVLIGAIMFLWRFSKRDFRRGMTFINSRIINFEKLINLK